MTPRRPNRSWPTSAARMSPTFTFWRGSCSWNYLRGLRTLLESITPPALTISRPRECPMVQVFWHVEPFRCAQQPIQDSPFAVNSTFEEDHMSDTAISLVVFAVVFGGAFLGLFLRTVLPQHHLSADSKDIVRLGMAFVVTTTALVLGLLVASAKGYFEAQAVDVTLMSAKVVLLDRVLAGYGPETKEVRSQLRA